MNVTFEEEALTLQAAGICLSHPQPVINGVPQTVWRLEKSPSRLCWHDPQDKKRRFGLEIHTDTESDSIWLHYWLEPGTSPQPPDDFGVRFARVSGAHTFLQNGYQSWDGSQYRAMAEAITEPRTGFAMIQFLAEAGSLLLGFDRHDSFQHTFTLLHTGESDVLDVLTLWDRKPVLPGLRCVSEKLVALSNAHSEAGRA